MSEKTFETKWGYVPYSYEDYRNLKRLNFIFQKARVRAAQWKRWVRKAPHNRVEKRWIRNDQNQKTGFEILGPLSEPETCDLFSKKLVDVDRNPLGRWFMGYIQTDDTVEIEYQKSHRPVLKDEAPEAGMSSEAIDQLLEKTEKWFKNQ